MSSRGRIMIVGGDAPSRAALIDLLADDGFIVASSEDDGEVGRGLDAFAPDVVIIDVGMPGTRAAALARASRSRPVLLLTAHDVWRRERDDPDDGRCISITKPVDFNALVILIDGLLALARSQPS